MTRRKFLVSTVATLTVSPALAASLQKSITLPTEQCIGFGPVVLSENDMDFIQARRFDIDLICRAYRLPPELLGPT